MNRLLDRLHVEGIPLKTMESVTPKELGIRNKIGLYYGYDVQKRAYVILHVTQKSRILQANVATFEAIVEKMSHYVGIAFKCKVLVISSPLCSKAESLLKKSGWVVVKS